VTDRITSPTAVDAVAFSGVSWRHGEDGERGIYVSAAPRGDGNSFVGAEVYAARSLDAGECWERLGGVTAPATMGFVRGWAVGAIQAHVPGDDGTGYSIEVEMLSGDLESYASIGEARCSRANLARIGSEIVRFQTATLGDDGISYSVTGFERGLFGTNSGSHSDSERFTVLDANTAFVELPADMLGRTVYVKIVPAGYTVDDVQAVDVDVPKRPDIIWDNRDTVGIFDAGLDPLVRDSVQGFTSVDTGDGVELRWREITDPALDYYEIRVGDQWGGAPVEIRTKDVVYALPRAPSLARTYRIRAYYVGGMLSPIEATTAITPATPDAIFAAVEAVDVPAEIAGHTNTELDDDDYIVLSDGYLSGNYEATAVDAGAVGVWDWVVTVDTHHQYLVPVDQWTFPIGSLESHRWTWAGPEPVPGSNGGDPDVTIEDFPPPEEWGQGWTTDGRVGSTSDFTRTKIEIRFDTTGSDDWTEYEEYKPARREAQKCQVRVTMSRVSEDWQRYVTSIRAEART